MCSCIISHLMRQTWQHKSMRYEFNAKWGRHCSAYTLCPSVIYSNSRKEKTKKTTHNCYSLDLIVADAYQQIHYGIGQWLLPILSNRYLSNRIINRYSDWLGAILLDFQQKTIVVDLALAKIKKFFSSSNFHFALWLFEYINGTLSSVTAYLLAAESV